MEISGVCVFTEKIGWAVDQKQTNFFLKRDERTWKVGGMMEEGKFESRLLNQIQLI